MIVMILLTYSNGLIIYINHLVILGLIIFLYVNSCFLTVDNLTGMVIGLPTPPIKSSGLKARITTLSTPVNCKGYLETGFDCLFWKFVSTIGLKSGGPGGIHDYI